MTLICNPFQYVYCTLYQYTQKEKQVSSVETRQKKWEFNEKELYSRIGVEIEKMTKLVARSYYTKYGRGNEWTSKQMYERTIQLKTQALCRKEEWMNETTKKEKILKK